MRAMASEKFIVLRDNRDDKRLDCEASISYSAFNKHEIFEGTILNFSKSGMYFESDTITKEGTTIYFRLTNCTVFPHDPDLCEGLRNASLAEVRWWREVKNRGKPCFGIGVKYYKSWHFQFRNNHHSAKRRA